jgi:asparagine synthase (glutamine-hydrolysing)
MPLVTPGEGPVTPALVEEATAGLTATARRIGALGGPIDLALSGGKDSRLLAAAFFEAGVEARLYTRAVYDDEAAIAVELVRRLGPGRVRHDIVGHGDTAGGFSFSDVPVDPLASARYLVSFSGGLYDPVHVGQLDAGGLGTPGVSGTPTVHGGLGEIAHNIYYPASTSPEEERDDRLLERKLVRRLVRKDTLTRWAERVARDAAGRVFAAGRAHGFAGVRLYDWFWLFERYRRMNPVPAYFDHLLPFADIGFVNTALSVDISEHRAHRLHRELTAALVPRWRDVPYFKPAAGSAARGRDLVVDAAAASLLTGDAYLRRFFQPGRLATAVGAVAGGTPERRDENVVKRALWLLALRAELGDGSDGPAAGHRWLAALPAVLRRASGR